MTLVRATLCSSLRDRSNREAKSEFLDIAALEVGDVVESLPSPWRVWIDKVSYELLYAESSNTATITLTLLAGVPDLFLGDSAGKKVFGSMIKSCN
jgi:hypothetical protein